MFDFPLVIPSAALQLLKVTPLSLMAEARAAAEFAWEEFFPLPSAMRALAAYSHAVPQCF